MITISFRVFLGGKWSAGEATVPGAAGTTKTQARILLRQARGYPAGTEIDILDIQYQR